MVISRLSLDFLILKFTKDVCQTLLHKSVSVFWFYETRGVLQYANITTNKIKALFLASSTPDYLNKFPPTPLATNHPSLHRKPTNASKVMSKYY